MEDFFVGKGGELAFVKNNNNNKKPEARNKNTHLHKHNLTM